eukprot:Colp12_sorted_trinity150504_noHs@29962
MAGVPPAHEEAVQQNRRVLHTLYCHNLRDLRRGFQVQYPKVLEEYKVDATEFTKLMNEINEVCAKAPGEDVLTTVFNVLSGFMFKYDIDAKKIKNLKDHINTILKAWNENYFSPRRVEAALTLENTKDGYHHAITFVGF